MKIQTSLSTSAALLKATGQSLETRAAYASPNACNCIIFRLDDFTDSWLQRIHHAILDLFTQRNLPLWIIIILAKYGNPSTTWNLVLQLREKTLAGSQSGLFDIGIHSWDTERYDSLTYDQQVGFFNQCNDKIESIFGFRTKSFGPPQNKFNSDTIRAMADTGIDIFSTTYYEESRTPNPYKVSTAYDTGKAIIQLSDYNCKRVFHIPVNVSYLGLIKKGLSGQALTDEVVRLAENNVSKFGYSIIALHPTDFSKIVDGKNTNEVDPARFQVLIDTIDVLAGKGYNFGHIRSVL